MDVVSPNPLALSPRPVDPSINFSTKGVPIVPAGVVSNFFGNSLRSPAEATNAQAVELAVQFVRDALSGRDPNTRLAIAAGVTGLRTSTSRFEEIINHWSYVLLLQVAVAVHCILAFFEDTPPASYAPPFSWTVGACEIACIALYCIDIALVSWTFGWRHFFDKRWDAVFVFVTLLSAVDWLLYYPGGLRGVFRFSRPLRPLLGIAKRSTLRRLLSSILWTIPALLEISMLLGVALCFYSTLGLQLFNRCVFQIPALVSMR